MPYAQSHYPFENKKEFEDAFPADFIAEGTDQTRGWFYTLLVLSSALFNKAPFKVILQIWHAFDFCQNLTPIILCLPYPNNADFNSPELDS